MLSQELIKFYKLVQGTSLCVTGFYQTVHFFWGFIFEPTGQLKSLAKSLLLDKEPLILNSAGE